MWQTAAMAAGGMGRPDDRLRATLAERSRTESGPAQRPDDGKPCWVIVGSTRSEGTIHAWWKDEQTGLWHALVIAWLPSFAVERR